MPDLLGVLTDGAVGGELGGGGHVHQALAAEGNAVGIVPVGLELGVEVGSVVQQQEVMVGLMPVGAVQQRMEQLLSLINISEPTRLLNIKNEEI